LVNFCIVYRLGIGLNNAEVRVASIFDPFNTEVHLADDLLNPDYVDFHFSIILVNFCIL
jgi:hypothetical protein